MVVVFCDDGRNLLVQRLEVLGFVVDGNDEREFHGCARVSLPSESAHQPSDTSSRAPDYGKNEQNADLQGLKQESRTATTPKKEMLIGKIERESLQKSHSAVA